MVKFEEAEEDEENKNHYKLMFPPCNVEWTPDNGNRVWCTKQRFDIVIESVFVTWW